MTIFTDGLREPPERGIEDYSTSLGESLGASATQGFEDLPSIQAKGMRELGGALRGEENLGSQIERVQNGEDINDVLDKPKKGNDVPIIDARQRVKEAGLDQSLKLPEQDSIKEPALNIMIDRARQERMRQVTMQRGPGGFVGNALTMGTSLFVGALDPLNAAAFAIPVLGEARYGKLMASGASSFMERFGTGAAVGAEKGIVGAAALAPLDYLAKTQEGQDFTMSDLLRSMMYGAGTMGLLHAGVGEAGRLLGREPPAPVARDLPSRAKEDVTQGAIASLMQDKPVQAAEHITAGASQDERILLPLSSEAAPEIGTVDQTHDVKSGAVSSKDTPGVTYIDPRIPEFSPILTDKDGNPANLHKYLAIHEQTERTAMASGESYLDAHTNKATPAERAAVEADGVDWKKYTEEMDGYLDKIEHEKVENPPPDPHVDPNAAVGHHQSENKAADAPARAPAEAANSGPPVPAPNPQEAWRAMADQKAAHEEPAAVAAGNSAKALAEPESIFSAPAGLETIDQKNEHFAKLMTGLVAGKKKAEGANTEASLGAANTPAGKAAAAAEAVWKQIEPHLSEEERAHFEGAVQRIDQDFLDAQTVLTQGAACLAAAVG